MPGLLLHHSDSRKKNPNCKGCPGTFCKGCVETGQSFGLSGDFPSNAAMDPAFCSAVRTTFVGSSTPASPRSSYSQVRALYPKVLSLESFTLLETKPDCVFFRTGILGGHCEAARAERHPRADRTHQARDRSREAKGKSILSTGRAFSCRERSRAGQESGRRVSDASCLVINAAD